MTGIITYRNFSLRDTPPLDGKVAVITGGQAGIGREITTQLLLHGVRKVFVLARSRDKYKAALEEWRARRDIYLGEEEERIAFVTCDLQDIRDVKEAADQIRRDTNRLDIVICNAGLGITPKYKLSPQDIEWIFASNCVGHQILVTLLLPLLRDTTIRYKTSDARVVVTSSSMHALCRHLDVDSLTSPTRFKPAIYDGIWRYGRSKLGNILFTRELSRRLLQAGDEGSKNIYANTFFPGNIATEQVSVWKEYVGRLGAWAVGKVLSVVGQTVSDGAATGMFLAASKKVKDEDIRGEYFIPVAKRDATTSVAKNMRLARELWNWVDKKAVETLGDEWRTADGRRLVDIQKR